jgi:hypothetical protein
VTGRDLQYGMSSNFKTLTLIFLILSDPVNG